MSSHPELIIGIDGGGSHTVALLAEKDESGRILGRGSAGPSNMQAVGEERAMQAIDEAVAQAFDAAQRTRGTVAAAALGLAGVDHPEAAGVVRSWCAKILLAESVSVANDATLLLEAGTPDGWGLAVIAGTGSIAFARSPDGKLDRSGGWGYLLGDEGSAYALALAGTRAVARSSDGSISRTRLTEQILAFMGLKEPLEMIHAVYRGDWDRARIATIAPLVLTAAEAGDAVAVAVVENEARELAKTALAAARKLALPMQRVPLALTGGAILNDAGYRDRFLAALRANGLNPEPVTLVDDPALGALRMARRLG
jgi:N-acetylmuramic acid 6-phosphate etherase